MTIHKTTVKDGYGGTRQTIDWDAYSYKGLRNYKGDDPDEVAYADSLADQKAQEILDKYAGEPEFQKRLAVAIGKKVLL